jgi:hypothetical protein
MNKSVWALMATAALCAAFTSCASSKTSSDVLAAYGDTGAYEPTAIASTPLSTANVTRYPTTLGDFDPIQLDEFFAMTLSFGKLKVKQITKFYLAPRSNTIEIYYRGGANSLCFIINQQSREGIIKAAQTFLEKQESQTLVDEKPTNTNSFYSGICDVWWGVATPANGAKNAKFHTNCKFIDGLPYFVIRFASAPSTTTQSTYSPYEELYFSPAQLRVFCDQIEQENLQSLVDEVSVKAYAY